MTTHFGILAWRIPWMRRLVGYSPWGQKESDMTEQLTLSLSEFIYSLPCLPRKVGWEEVVFQAVIILTLKPLSSLIPMGYKHIT